jgi:hypothetical protein
MRMMVLVMTMVMVSGNLSVWKGYIGLIHIKLVHYSQTGHIAEYVDVYSPLLYTPNPPGCPRCNHFSGEDEVVEEDF